MKSERVFFRGSVITASQILETFHLLVQITSRESKWDEPSTLSQDLYLLFVWFLRGGVQGEGVTGEP